MDIKSAPGQGSRFTLSAPLRSAQPVEEATAPLDAVRTNDAAAAGSAADAVQASGVKQ